MNDLWTCTRCGYDRNPLARAACFGCGALKDQAGLAAPVSSPAQVEVAS